MPSPTIAPYGSWKSPITADLIVGRSIGLGQIMLDGEDVYWTESRPAEAGRSALVRFRNGVTEEVIPAPFNVRTRVHEYGGGAYLAHDGTIYFSNFKDQRLYRTSATQAPTPITPEAESRLRYADAVADERRNRLICVREDHTAGGEPVNKIGRAHV